MIRRPSAGLLFIQLLGVLLYPWMEATALGLALHVVKRSPTQT